MHTDMIMNIHGPPHEQQLALHHPLHLFVDWYNRLLVTGHFELHLGDSHSGVKTLGAGSRALKNQKASL